MFQKFISTTIGAISGVIAYKLTTELECNEKEVVLATAGAAGIGASITSMAIDAIVHKTPVQQPKADISEEVSDEYEETYEENAERLEREIEEAIEAVSPLVEKMMEEQEDADEDSEDDEESDVEEPTPEAAVPEGIVQTPADSSIPEGVISQDSEQEHEEPADQSASDSFAANFVEAAESGDDAVNQMMAELDQEQAVEEPATESNKIEGSVLNYVKGGKRKHPNDTGEKESRLERKFQ